MSYILDALRKSDRDRRRNVPPVAADARPEFRAGPPVRRSGLVRALGMGALVAIGVAAGAWIAREPAPTAVVPLADTRIPVLPAAGADPTPDAASATGPAESGAPSVISPGAAPPTPAVESPAQAATADEPRERPPGPLELWQLTDAEQRYLQGLDVSFHVYSPDPVQRAVIVNGLRAREGQSLGEDLRLAEIVADGVILEFQGQLVHLPNPQPY